MVKLHDNMTVLTVFKVYMIQTNLIFGPLALYFWGPKTAIFEPAEGPKIVMLKGYFIVRIGGFGVPAGEYPLLRKQIKKDNGEPGQPDLKA